MARPAKTAVQLRLMRTTSKLGGAVGTVPAAGAGVGGGTDGGASILACGGMPRLLLSAPKKITARIPTTATPRRMKKKRLPRTRPAPASQKRSEEHTSELPSLMRISYADFCLKKKPPPPPPPPHQTT